MLTANECRENAKLCVAQAAETSDPVLKRRLAETAQGWARLAADYATLEDPIAERPISQASSISALLKAAR